MIITTGGEYLGFIFVHGISALERVSKSEEVAYYMY